jgi:cysteine desulfurase
MRRVYLDNAATTAVKPEVVQAMLPYLTQYFGNPSSLPGFAREARAGLDNARAQVGRCAQRYVGRNQFNRRTEGR